MMKKKKRKKKKRGRMWVENVGKKLELVGKYSVLPIYIIKYIANSLYKQAHTCIK